jgi:NSS family neurotransmitter:Na+ symporter
LAQRAQWGSRIGFILAASGSAVGLGNIWKFPYETGVNGGGAFVVVYLICVLLVGLPVMIAEILLGRSTQKSPVGAVRELSNPRSPWQAFGWLGVASSFVVLSFYSIVAGWSLHYTWLALTGDITGVDASSLESIFAEVFASPGVNLFWHTCFMAITVAIVLGGVAKGLERWARILMPALFIMLVALLFKSFTLEGFSEGMSFVFGFHSEKLTAEGVLAALGQAFFSLSLGMGSMVTYGSYLRKQDDIVSTSITISFLDTLIAILAAVVVFPIIFTFGLEPSAGPGLVFVSIPVALSQVTGGALFISIFFGLLVFAAITSAISMLETTCSYFMDEHDWTRKRATLVAGTLVVIFGIPSALSGSTMVFGQDFAAIFGRNWFNTADYLATNWMLPLGGLGISLFTAWRMNEAIRRDNFLSGTKLGVFYRAWILLLKLLVPVAITFVFLHAVGII